MDVNSTANSTTGPEELPQWKKILLDIYPVITPLVLVIIMLAMGASVTVKDIWVTYKRPVGIAIGACSQFILFPLVSFGFAHATKLEQAQALGFLIAACCPGGTTSNIFAYYTEGDLPLSIAMTVTATVLALGFMPLNLFIYARSWASDQIKVPFDNIAITLVSILIPVAVGMLIKWKLEKVARIITKLGTAMGLLLILVVSVFQALLYPHIYTAYWKVWVIGIIWPYVGFLVGYLFAFICRQNPVHRRTIAIETGVQNMGVAFTIIGMSFKEEFAAEATIIPIVFAFFMVLEGFSLIAAYRIYRAFQNKRVIKKNIDENDVNIENENGDIKLKDIGENEQKEKSQMDIGLNNIAYSEN